MAPLIMLLLVPAAAGQGGCVFAPHDWVATTTLKSISAATPAACCAGCAATAGCEAGILDAAGQCYLKAGLQSSTGCRNCTSCTLRAADSARSFEFGPPRFRLRLSASTLGLQNISVGSADGAFTQGFVMNTMPPPKRTEYALWHMNVTDCGSALPQGTRVTPCLGADCGNVSHAVSADGTMLTLRWAGVPLPPPFTARLDVTATVTQLPDTKPGVSLRGAVALSPGSSGRVCLQNLALPTLEGIPMRSEQTESMFSPDYFVRRPAPPPQHATTPRTRPLGPQERRGLLAGARRQVRRQLQDGHAAELGRHGARVQLHAQRQRPRDAVVTPDTTSEWTHSAPDAVYE